MKGIDYGMGQTNIDKETGIRFGVINANEVCQAWNDNSEGDYGEPTCPKCGNEVVEYDDEKHCDYHHFNKGHRSCSEYACESCELHGETSDVAGEDPIGWVLDNGKYKATQGGDDCDIFILKSPYYTTCAFCSPCAPGAGYITDFHEDGIKAYCFGHDWFDEGKAPYKVFRVSDGSEVLPETT